MSRSHSTLFVQLRESPTPNPECFSLLNHARYDANDNVSSITDGVTPGNSQALGYDVLDRLTSATGGYGALSYTYDKLGNRLKQTASGALTGYSYQPGSNRLASITAGGSTTPMTYTGTGNIKSIPPTTGAPTASLTYNAANRLATVTGTPLAITGMVYDAFGQRFSKTSGGTANYFTYGQDGTLMEENDGGFPIDYVYLNARPVVEIVPSTGKVYFLHDDRLGTPQLATDGGQSVVWKADYQPFGATSLVVGSINQNLRLPGQHSDLETGFNYNVSRDYMPNIGRYLESDPIGLAGGQNRYVYVGQNPSEYVDPKGLAIWIEGPSGDEPTGHQSINIGDPFGHYDSYSFGVSPRCFGCVYLDTDRGGEIGSFLNTTPQQDAQARNEILNNEAKDSLDWYGPHTCRTYSQFYFERFAGEFLRYPSIPPQRTPAPRTLWRLWTAPSSGSTSSTTSSTNSGPSQ